MNARRLGRITVLALVLGAPSARATGNFPDAIRQDLALSAAPPCAYCHSGGVTGRGTVETPFGSSLRARGLVAYDEDSLKRSIDRLEADNVDSDGDGISDIAELRAGTDPNQGSESVEPVSYGCNMGRTGPTFLHNPRTWGLLVVALLLWLGMGRGSLLLAKRQSAKSP